VVCRCRSMHGATSSFPTQMNGLEHPPNQRLPDYVLARPDFVGAGPPKGGTWRVFNNLIPREERAG
jgi:hypothetical protein